MLLTWSLNYKPSFSPHTFQMWNNKCILYKNNSFFFFNWFDSNNIYVKQLLDPEGFLMAYSELLSSNQRLSLWMLSLRMCWCYLKVGLLYLIRWLCFVSLSDICWENLFNSIKKQKDNYFMKTLQLCLMLFITGDSLFLLSNWLLYGLYFLNIWLQTSLWIYVSWTGNASS